MSPARVLRERALAELMRWRRGLTAEERSRLRSAREDGRLVLVGLPIDDASELETWRDELREYVQNRDDLVFHLEERTWHICRAHPLARTIIVAGLIPAAFACGWRACPFGSAARGRPVQLVAVPWAHAQADRRRCCRSSSARPAPVLRVWIVGLLMRGGDCANLAL